MDITEFENIARMLHIQNYRLCGDRYCTDKELEMHVNDPLACYELVRDQLIVMTGYYIWTRHQLNVADSFEIEAACKRVVESMRYTVEKFPGRRYDKGEQ